MTDVPLDVRVSLLRQHGAFSQAYSATFQPGLQRFGDERGFLAYKMVGKTALALSDPLAPSEYRKDLLVRFIREKRDVCFWQVSRPIAEILASQGFFINEMGTETRLDLANYNFAGRKKRTLRLAFNRMMKLGYVTVERPAASLNAQELRAVSESWRQTRTFREVEVAFLNRPPVLGDEPDVRKFYTFDHDGKLLAFGFFDPVYEKGHVAGYLYSIKRRLPKADILAGYAILHRAIESFKEEGRRWLFLGLSPFAGIADKEFPRNWLIMHFFRFAYWNPLINRFVFPFQGHAQHKREFYGTAKQTYYAFNRRPSLPRVLKVLWACDLIYPEVAPSAIERVARPAP